MDKKEKADPTKDLLEVKSVLRSLLMIKSNPRGPGAQFCLLGLGFVCWGSVLSAGAQFCLLGLSFV